MLIRGGALLSCFLLLQKHRNCDNREQQLPFHLTIVTIEVRIIMTPFACLDQVDAF